MAGQPLKLADYRGKLVFVDFWATWCAPCVAEMPNILKVHERFHADGFEVIGISLDGSAATVRRFVKNKQIPWPQILAEGGERGPLATSYGVAGIPATYLIGPDGKVLAKDLRGRKLLQRVESEMAKLKADKQATQPSVGHGGEK